MQHLAVLERNRQMIDIGAYEKGANAELDRAMDTEPGLQAWLRQSVGGVGRMESIHHLRAILAPTAEGKKP